MCEYCRDENPKDLFEWKYRTKVFDMDISVTHYVDVYGESGKMSVGVKHDVGDTSMLEADKWEEIKINFCPMCGRKIQKGE